MSIIGVKALTFDTGGTILDWYSGFYNAFEKLRVKHNVEINSNILAREIRKKSLSIIINQDQKNGKTVTFDEAHFLALEFLIKEYDLNFISPQEKVEISFSVPHSLTAWKDFPAILPLLKNKIMCVSFTLLNTRLVIDTARKNNLSWDGIISCEMIGTYKPLPLSYQTAANWLNLKPSECAMVACHNFDLNAAKEVGFKTIFVKRDKEWGPDGSIDPIPNPDHDLIVNNFEEILKYI